MPESEAKSKTGRFASFLKLRMGNHTAIAVLIGAFFVSLSLFFRQPSDYQRYKLLDNGLVFDTQTGVSLSLYEGESIEDAKKRIEKADRAEVEKKHKWESLSDAERKLEQDRGRKAELDREQEQDEEVIRQAQRKAKMKLELEAIETATHDARLEAKQDLENREVRKTTAEAQKVAKARQTYLDLVNTLISVKFFKLADDKLAAEKDPVRRDQLQKALNAKAYPSILDAAEQEALLLTVKEASGSTKLNFDKLFEEIAVQKLNETIAAFESN